jgi:peptidyl-prolyl cis-trans isomerase B (cyclophilin B)
MRMLAMVLTLVVAMSVGFTSVSAQTSSTPAKQDKKAMTYIMTVKQGNKELGKITIKLGPEIAPKHCAFWDARVAEGWYDGSAFHRVIPGFMIQGGDPNSKDQARESWGTGGYKETVPAEFSAKKHVRGVLSAARTNDPNSFSGQFFLCVADSPWLDNQYTAFGEVVSGMEVADMVVNTPRDPRDNPLEKITFTVAKGK